MLNILYHGIIQIKMENLVRTEIEKIINLAENGVDAIRISNHSFNSDGSLKNNIYLDIICDFVSPNLDNYVYSHLEDYNPIFEYDLNTSKTYYPGKLVYNRDGGGILCD